jgi:hypothetical protein
MRGQKATPKDTPATPPPTPDLFDSRAVLKPTQFLFPDDLKKRLRALSFEQDRSMSDIVREAVEQYLGRGGE